MRGALVQEGAQAFLAFGRHPQARDQRGVVAVQRVAVATHADPAHQFLGRGRGHRAGLVQQAQLALDRLVDAFRFDQLVYQADPQRGLGIEMLAGGKPAAGLARADRVDHVGGNHRRQQAQPAFGQPEAGGGAGNGDVAAGDQAHPATEGGALDPCDGGLGQLVQGAHQPRQRQRILAVVFLAGGGHAAHPLHVRARRKRRALAGQYHRTDLFVTAGRLQRCGELGDQGRIEGVVQGGAVQPQRQHRGAAFYP